MYIVISNLNPYLPSTCLGVSRAYLQEYIAEFVFRFDLSLFSGKILNLSWDVLSDFSSRQRRTIHPLNRTRIHTSRKSRFPLACLTIFHRLVWMLFIARFRNCFTSLAIPFKLLPSYCVLRKTGKWLIRVRTCTS